MMGPLLVNARHPPPGQVQTNLPGHPGARAQADPAALIEASPWGKRIMREELDSQSVNESSSHSFSIL
jgi:hypothetical protein